MAILKVNCMECDNEIELGEFDATVVAEWVTTFPALLTNVICDPCLIDVYDIDVAQILTDIENYDFDDDEEEEVA